MNYGPELLLVAAVATVGVLHTIVPDHWVPTTLIARHASRQSWAIANNLERVLKKCSESGFLFSLALV